tara:strand:- start:44370 stop:45842 length:1473 start_codon:yes stop_codon:yes gene_type:complete
MAINFPGSPSDGQTHTDSTTGSVWEWNATYGYWQSVGTGNYSNTNFTLYETGFANTNVNFSFANVTMGSDYIIFLSDQNIDLTPDVTYSSTGSLATVFDKANTACTQSDTAGTNANTGITNAATAQALGVSAFGRANTANLTANNNLITVGAAFTQANNSNITARAAFTRANNSNITARAAFSKANAANLLAFTSNVTSLALGAAAFGRANTANLTANNNLITVGSAYDHANAISVSINSYATSIGTSGNAYATSVGTSGNAYAVVIGSSSNAYSEVLSGAAFDKANTASLEAGGAHATANDASSTAGAAFDQANSTVSGTFTKYQYNAGAQNTYAAVYTTGYIDVFINGAKLANTDFTATSGTEIVLTEDTIANDVVEIIAWTISSVTAIAGGPITLAYASKTSNYTIVPVDDYLIDCSANSFPVTLPTAAAISGQHFIVKNSNDVGSGNNINVITTSSQTIDGDTDYINITPKSALTFASTNTNWILI